MIYLYIAGIFGIIYGTGQMIHFMQNDQRALVVNSNSFGMFIYRGALGIFIIFLATAASALLMPLILIEEIIKKVKK